MTREDVAAKKLTLWIQAGDRAQDKYGYEGAGRALFEQDIKILLEERKVLIGIAEDKKHWWQA